MQVCPSCGAPRDPRGHGLKSVLPLRCVRVSGGPFLPSCSCPHLYVDWKHTNRELRLLCLLAAVVAPYKGTYSRNNSKRCVGRSVSLYTLLSALLRGDRGWWLRFTFQVCRS